MKTQQQRQNVSHTQANTNVETMTTYPKLGAFQPMQSSHSCITQQQDGLKY